MNKDPNMKSTTAHEDQFAPDPTSAEEEAWREIEKRQSSRSDAGSEPPAIKPVGMVLNERRGDYRVALVAPGMEPGAAVFSAPVSQPWQALAAALYQASGAYDMPVRVLDVLSAAANGEPFAHLVDGLLPVEAPVAQEPSGYAYRYPDGCIRFSNGSEINGSKPTETIPYWFSAPVAAQAQPTGKESLTTEQPVSAAYKLPPLPEACIVSYQTDSTMRSVELRTYSDEDMRDYARAALTAQASPPKWLTSYAVQASAIQEDVEFAVVMLGSREYTEHWAKTDLGKRLENALTTMHDELSAQASGKQCTWAGVHPDCAQASRQDREDAERYRYLRDNAQLFSHFESEGNSGWCVMYRDHSIKRVFTHNGQELDEAIDHARRVEGDGE